MSWEQIFLGATAIVAIISLFITVVAGYVERRVADQLKNEINSRIADVKQETLDIISSGYLSREMFDVEKKNADEKIEEIKRRLNRLENKINPWKSSENNE